MVIIYLFINPDHRKEDSMADFTATEVVDGSVLRFLVVDKDIDMMRLYM